MRVEITAYAAMTAVDRYKEDGRPQIEARLLTKARDAADAASAIDYVAAMNPVPAGIAASFRTARHFPKSDPKAPRRSEDYAIASQLVNDHGRGLATVAGTVHAVDFIAKELQAARRANGKPYTTARKNGGGVLPLSAVSKWVWFVSPDVAVIYDDLGRTSMQFLGYHMPEGDYALYCCVFQHLLRVHVSKLLEAGDCLVGLLAQHDSPLSQRTATRKVLDLILVGNAKPIGKVPEGAPLEDADLFPIGL